MKTDSLLPDLEKERTMKFTGFWFACVVCLANMIFSVRADAQPPLPGGSFGAPRPTFSPYLNLNRAGSSTALNYYGIIRPELQFRQSLSNLQGSVATNQQMIGNLQNDPNGLSATGHQIQFMNYGNYFLSNGPTAATEGFGQSVIQRTNQIGQAPRPASGRRR